jgi:RND family efflux transporter MFP subunit
MAIDASLRENIKGSYMLNCSFRGMRHRGLAFAGIGLLVTFCQMAPAAAEDFIGIVYPSRDLALSFGVGGLVAAVNVEVGDRVEAGKVLIGLDERMASIEVERRRGVAEDRSEVQSLEDRLAILNELFSNAAKLFDLTGGISQEEVQKLKLELGDTRGRIEQLKARKQREALEYRAAEQERQSLRMLAPVNGVVTRLDLDVGEWAKPGEVVLQMVDTSKCYLRVSVGNAAARSLTAGMKLPIQIDGAANSTFNGRLSYIAPVADAASGLVELRVTFDNPRGQVRPGASGRVRIGSR